MKAFLIATKVPHTEKIIDTLKGEHKTPEYLKIYPAGVVPCITVDG